MKPCQFTVFYTILFQDTAKPWPLGQRLLQKGLCNYCCCLKGVYLGNLSSPVPLSARPSAPWPRKVHSNCEKISSNNHTLGILVLCHLYNVGGKRVCFKIRGAWIHRVSCFILSFHQSFLVAWIVCKFSCHFTQHERGALSLEWSNKNRRPNQTKLKRSFYHLTTPTATVQFWSETFPGYNFGTSSFAAGWNKRNMI